MALGEVVQPTNFVLITKPTLLSIFVILERGGVEKTKVEEPVKAGAGAGAALLGGEEERGCRDV